MSNSDVFVYAVDLPTDVHEMVSPGYEDDYTVYVNSRLSDAGQRIAYRHAVRHTVREDFGKEGADQIEGEVHRKGE